ncbi:hypothetical protein Tco_0937204 [Tanacetum coccineum]|uniref:Uncharacterized protein n=1 Tax=Tanacetum coccineum TaxID=301880 RepID=A0ABQ5DEB1_9ASTR
MGFNLLVHSFRALSTLRRSDLRTASAAAKSCQGDSSEVYLITNADHAGFLDMYKSTSGGIHFLGGKLVSWSSKNQDCTAMSTVEANMLRYLQVVLNSFGREHNL